MNRRIVKQIYRPIRDDIADLRTARALPTQHIDHIDPFLFLNHHGPQVYPPHNHGLPFGPHPHRGFETITFILKGDIAHRDSGGHESVIKAGGIQWMTAGKGLVHSETSSEEFKRHGGDLEVLQLWLNLPSRLKMSEPKYIGLQAESIPHYSQGGVTVDLIAGEWQGHKGAVSPLIDVSLMTIKMLPGAETKMEISEKRNIFFYLIQGDLEVNGITVNAPHLVEFENRGSEIILRANEDSLILFGHAEPFNEPIVAYGPFVMNTREEIMQAIRDFSP